MEKRFTIMRSFTLLELIIVIIIIGVLAILGFTQYGRMVERARGAEARTILGDIRTKAAAWYMEYQALDGSNGSPVFTPAAAGIGVNLDQIPSACRGTHYFSYGFATGGAAALTGTATRCGATGKVPSGGAATGTTLTLATTLTTGADIWGGSGGY